MRYLLALLLCATAHAIDYEFVGGSIDKFILISMYATDGTADTGLAYTDMTITYTRNNGAADVDVTEATMTMGTHADGGWIEVDATNSPGLYQFGIPDAAIADGAESVVFSFKATGAVPKFAHALLYDVDFRAGANVYADVKTIETADATDTINAQADLAIADYDPPTKTELDSGFAGLNNLSAAQVNSEVDTALADYDPPTNTEMEARTLVAANYFDPTADTVANVTTLAGHTPQTADHSASIAAILADTAAVDTQSELRTLLMGSNVAPASSTALATAQGNITSILADTGAVDTTTEMRTFLTGADTPVAKESSLSVLSTDLSTAQADLDTLTNGVTLAASQPNYAPAKAGDSMALVAAAVDSIWDEDIVAAHTTSDTAGKKLADAGSASDPWSVAVPGAYGAGTAGYVVGAISSNTTDLQTDWANGGRLDTILDELTTQGDTNKSAIDLAQADLDILSGTDGATLATSQPNYPTPPTASAIRTEIESGDLALVLADTDELQTRFSNMIEADGVDWRFVTNALEQGAAGSGGDASAANQTTILDRLAGIMDKTHILSVPVGSFDPSTDSLEAIKDLGDINWSGSLAGLGSTPVNQDFGGEDALTVQYLGAGVESVQISAYVKSEYDANPYTATRRALVLTSADGTWEQAMMLNSGTTYTLVFYKAGAYGPDTTTITP